MADPSASPRGGSLTTTMSSKMAMAARNGVIRRAHTQDPNALAAAAPITKPNPLYQQKKMLLALYFIR